jgi:predicted transcriptional regulator
MGLSRTEAADLSAYIATTQVVRPPVVILRTCWRLVLQLMVSLKSRSFPVIGPDHQLLGIISREDVIRALKEAIRLTPPITACQRAARAIP